MNDPREQFLFPDESQERDGLRARIVAANKAYRLGRPVMDDQTFDDLLDRYRELVPADEFAAFRDTLHEETGRVAHPFLMGSLDKLKAEEPEKVLEFLAKYVPDGRLDVSAKVDGISCRVRYENGLFASATTRGDGHAGLDVTAKVALVRGVPPMVPAFADRAAVDVRGELVIVSEDFVPIADRFQNPRNATAGIMGQKELDRDLLARVSFVCYEIMGGELGKKEQFARLEAAGFRTAKHRELALDPASDYVPSFVDRLRDMAEEDCGYGTDGLVLCGWDYRAENKYRPDAQMAFKLNALEGESTVEGVDWGAPSKDGRLSPVAVLAPIALGGTTVTRATLNNLDFIAEKGIRIGSKVRVLKSGDVIPKIVAVENAGGTKEIVPPAECPACGAALVRDSVHLRCPNEECPSRRFERVARFIERLGIKRVSLKTVEDLGLDSIEKLLSFRPAPGYKIQAQFASDLAGKLFTASRETLFKAMNFQGLAEKMLSKILDFYGLEAVEAWDADPGKDFAETMGFPKDVAEARVAVFKADAKANLALLRLITSDPRWHGKSAVRKTGGESRGAVCFTGALATMTRDEAAKKAEEAGFAVRSDVTKALSYLVTNTPESGSSKNKKAQALGIPILTEEQFLALLDGAEATPPRSEE
jgi:DNA ligase (NAD+)